MDQLGTSKNKSGKGCHTLNHPHRAAGPHSLLKSMEKAQAGRKDSHKCWNWLESVIRDQASSEIQCIGTRCQVPPPKTDTYFTFQQAAAAPSHRMAQATQRRAGKCNKFWHKQMLFQCSEWKDVSSKFRLNVNILEKF